MLHGVCSSLLTLRLSSCICHRALGCTPPPKKTKDDRLLLLHTNSCQRDGGGFCPDVQRIASKQLEDQVSLLKSLGLSPDHVHNSLRRLAMLGDRGRSSHVNEALLNFLGAPRSVSAATFDSHVPAANPATVPAQHFGWLLSE